MASRVSIGIDGVSLPQRHTLHPDAANDPTLLFKSYHTRNPIGRVIEGISNVINDTKKESYGLSGDHLFRISGHTFHATGCYWECKVEYEAHLPIYPKPKRGAFGIEMRCYRIEANDEENFSDNSDNEYDEKILAVDIILRLGTTKDNVNGNELSSLQKLFYLLCLDVWRSLSIIGFPEFPEGCRDKFFKEIYQLNDQMKSGQFGTVCLGTHRATGRRAAIKIIMRKDMKPIDDASVFNEVDILASLKHEYICPLLDFFVQPDCFFIVMQLMEGGDLFDRLGSIQTYNEDEARKLCKKLLVAVNYCHEQNIVHCDLKPKNLVLLTKSDDSSIKLADFGFATRFYGPNSLTKQCGTPYFVAPEILLNNGYGEKADMWSVGVITYILLYGKLPFTGKKHLDLFKAIISGRYSFDGENDGISDDSKALVKGLLVTDPSKRWSASEALNCVWIGSDIERQHALRRRSLLNVTHKLKGFNGRLAWESAILKVRTIIYWKNIVARRRRSEPAQSQNDNKE